MATPYDIKISPKAHQSILKFSSADQKTIIQLIEALSINPRPPGSQKIEGMTGLYCETIQHLHLVYKIDEQQILILIVRSSTG